MERFEELEVWQTAHALVLEVYRLTKGFPDHEKFGLVSQMRRAAVSVPANIAPPSLTPPSPFDMPPSPPSRNHPVQR